jgi:hypothetical protein
MEGLVLQTQRYGWRRESPMSRFVNSNSTTRRFSCAVIAATVAIMVSLSGCSDEDGSAKTDIFQALQRDDHDLPATVNLDEVVEGQWDKVLIVCRGVEPDSVDAALGFHWDRSKIVSAAGFAEMLVFYTPHSVESVANFGQDKFVANDLYASPCLPKPPANTIAKIDRPESTMTFEYNGDDFPPGWELTPAYSESLNWIEYR